MLRGAWAAYERALAARPVRTQMATSAVLWGLGDLAAQRIEHWEAAAYGPEGAAPRTQQEQQQQHKQQPSASIGAAAAAAASIQAQQQQQPGGGPASSIDTRRLALTSAFGAGFIGPVGHLWYEGIEKVCRRLVPGGGPRFLVTKVVLDSAIMGSVYVVAFFAFIAGALEGSGLDGFRHKMRVDFVPTYAAELAFWPLVQAVNFSQVPVRHQLLVVNTFSLADAAFISWVGNQSDWSGKLLRRLQGLGGGSDQAGHSGGGDTKQA